MKAIGSIFRYVLNINTVWGLMILSAFAACVVQHYLPTTSRVPAGQLASGRNVLTLRLAAAGKVPARSFELPVVLEHGELSVPADLRIRSKERPWLISVDREGTAWRIRWDYEGYGRYELLANGMPVARGRLVTLQSFTDAAFEFATKGFEIALGLVASMVLFLGLMKVGEEAGIVQIVARVFHPVIRLMFPGIPREHPASGAVLMNMTTGVLGLGNAATPFGLKAMKELETLNPHPGVATDAQVTLLAWNTGGFALLPTTLLAVRKAAGCRDPFEIIGTCLIAGAVSSIMAIIMARLLAKLPFFTVQAALAEEAVAGRPADAGAGKGGRA
jgi:spore maturation protein A